MRVELFAGILVDLHTEQIHCISLSLHYDFIYEKSALFFESNRRNLYPEE